MLLHIVKKYKLTHSGVGRLHVAMMSYAQPDAAWCHQMKWSWRDKGIYGQVTSSKQYSNKC